jgi:hypothetical protein
VNRGTIVATWSWMMLATILEVAAGYYLTGASWIARDGSIAVIMLTAIIPVSMVNLGLLEEHVSVRVFILAGLFFAADLILIWTASLVH